MSQGAGPKSRGLLSAIWNNFRKSLSVASAEEGALVGRDPFGNTFYEIPADPRWVQCVPLVRDTFTQYGASLI